jgi:hypothetical protein
VGKLNLRFSKDHEENVHLGLELWLSDLWLVAPRKHIGTEKGAHVFTFLFPKLDYYERKRTSRK